jgi:hypothetical protein
MTNPPQEIRITRKNAARLLEQIRKLLSGPNSRHPAMLDSIRMLLKDAGITPLTECHGEAHDNPLLNACPVCAPNWGLVGSKIRIRRD